jgi:Mg-chelatase subunit ChlI
MKRVVMPFTAIVGQKKLKQSLVLNAINPNLLGVLVRGEKGTGKSTAVRALADLLPEIDVVKCPFNCSPDNPSLQCSACNTKYMRGNKLPTTARKSKVVELPLGATEDRVTGTLDIEKALREGIKALEPGILAEVNQGILYIDEVNLLDDHLVDVLLDSAAMGVNTVEREGISVSHPSKFILVGTMNPEEGEIRPQLLDRFGLSLDIKGTRDAAILEKIREEAGEAQAADKECTGNLQRGGDCRGPAQNYCRHLPRIRSARA